MINLISILNLIKSKRTKSSLNGSHVKDMLLTVDFLCDAGTSKACQCIATAKIKFQRTNPGNYLNLDNLLYIMPFENLDQKTKKEILFIPRLKGEGFTDFGIKNTCNFQNT